MILAEKAIKVKMDAAAAMHSRRLPSSAHMKWPRTEEEEGRKELRGQEAREIKKG